LFSFNLSATDDEKIQLAGDGEKNFIGIERTYKVKLLTRNPGITIQASEEGKVKSAQAALERMRDAMRTGHQLTDFYVSEILAGSSVGEGQPGDFTPHLEKPILMDPRPAARPGSSASSSSTTSCSPPAPPAQARLSWP
jgi:phosphate starvation-inducible protein PhoH